MVVNELNSPRVVALYALDHCSRSTIMFPLSQQSNFHMCEAMPDALNHKNLNQSFSKVI